LPTGLGFNSQLAKREEVPRNYRELLSPKWKGRKISVDDESYELLIGLMQAWGRNAAVEYLKKVAAQEPMILAAATRREPSYWQRASFRWRSLIRIRWNGPSPRETPVDWVNLEPVVIKFGGVMVGSKAEHPNAARLFVDFILSQQGQELLQSFSRVTLRNGVEPNPPRLIKGFKRVVLHPEKAQDAQESLKLYREIFGLP
jgi:iron(III) transport system substrate-binding protein